MYLKKMTAYFEFEYLKMMEIEDVQSYYIFMNFK